MAAVGVHRGGCDVGLLRTVIPYIPQAITLHKLHTQGNSSAGVEMNGLI